MHRLLYSSPQLQFASKDIVEPTTIRIPTRHGEVKALVYAPMDSDIARQLAEGNRPPVHLITHGGAFVIGVPKQEHNVARYLASEVGCYVVIPDYHTAPSVRFPVEEEEAFDVFRWVHEHGGEQGWDGDRVTIGGASSGGKLALSVALLAIEEGSYRPLAVSSEYAVVDVARSDESRTTTKKSPVVGPNLMKLVRETYFAGADLTTPGASPARHPRRAELPPTLIITAEYDTLKHESNDLAADLKSSGVLVTHREFPGVDHGFTHAKPVASAREALVMIGDHLAAAYTKARV
jgi:acetyl esterase